MIIFFWRNNAFFSVYTGFAAYHIVHALAQLQNMRGNASKQSSENSYNKYLCIINTKFRCNDLASLVPTRNRISHHHTQSRRSSVHWKHVRQEVRTPTPRPSPTKRKKRILGLKIIVRMNKWCGESIKGSSGMNLTEGKIEIKIVVQWCILKHDG